MADPVGANLFEEPGPQNTQATLDVALRRAQALGLGTLIVATDTGRTAQQVLAACAGSLRVIAVSNPPGMTLPIAKLHDYLPRFRQYREELAAKGVTTVPASLAEADAQALRDQGATVLRVDWRKLSAFTRNDLRALDCIGVGVRVGVTVALAAMLAGAIEPGADVATLSGTGFGGGGADTALVVRTASRWRDWRVLEILARPRVGPPAE
jgi:uncharacterized protein